VTKPTPTTYIYAALRSQRFDTDTDWNIISEPSAGINNRQVALTRGRFLGGSSGVNGTLCIRGTKQDYDDWNLPGWSGEEVFGYMNKVRQEACHLPANQNDFMLGRTFSS
jgi:choline dehydrogenase-like flavoprotein